MYKKNIVANITVSQYLGELEIQGQHQPYSDSLSLPWTTWDHVSKSQQPNPTKPKKKAIQQQTSEQANKQKNSKIINANLIIKKTYFA